MESLLQQPGFIKVSAPNVNYSVLLLTLVHSGLDNCGHHSSRHTGRVILASASSNAH